MKFVQYLLSAAFASTVTTAFSPVQISRLQPSCSSSSSSSFTTLFAQEQEAGEAETATPITAEIQFVRGLTEHVVPNVRLTRARDGSSGVASFTFDSPNVFDASTAAKGEITGMFMMDDEGEISTTAVNASFANGKPQTIESTYVMNSPEEWDRFMRFMQKYGEANGLGFNKA